MPVRQRIAFFARVWAIACVALLGARVTQAAEYPAPVEGDYTIRNFRFSNGETLPELRIHYRTLGKPQKDAKGIVRNAVLIGHGTGGTGAQFIRPEFAGELFGAGQLLDATKYFIVLAGWHRSRQVREAERRAAREVSAVRLHGHGGGAVPPAHRRARRESPAARDGHVDGRHAHVGVGRALSRNSWTR